MCRAYRRGHPICKNHGSDQMNGARLQFAEQLETMCTSWSLPAFVCLHLFFS